MLLNADKFSDLTLECAANANLTIQNLYIQNNVGLGTPSGQTTEVGYHIINFPAGNNSLNFEGINLLENQEYVKAAGIHVPPTSNLTIGASCRNQYDDTNTAWSKTAPIINRH